MSKTDFKNYGYLFGGFLASGILLTLIQAPFDLSYLAWFSLVPFIIVCKPEAKKWKLALVAYAVSACYWLGNLYWISYVTVPAYILLCLYLGLYWPIVALCIRWLRRKNWPALFLFMALLFAGAEALQGMLFTGFNWRLLAHSQYRILPIIQIADIFGSMGITVIVAMVNCLIADVLIIIKNNRRLHAGDFLKIAVVAALVAGTLLYGYQQLDKQDEFIIDGPMIGAVQPNVPSHVKEMAESGPEILDDLLEQTKAATEAGAVLAAWPETIVLCSLNSSYLSLCEADSNPRKFDKLIRDYCRDTVYVLAGAHGMSVGVEGMEYVITDRYNSAYLYRPDGKQDPKRYDKIHLVPFGEYIPFKYSIPWIYNIILGLSPYDYDYNLTRGKEYTRFKINADGQEFGFGVLICYEDTDGNVTRKMVCSDREPDKAGWLVNISNDGWYVRFKNEKVLPSVELPQRTAITALRAVENRISIIRSVNTGISCLVEPCGRIRDGFAAGNLPNKVMDRQGVEGWFVDKVPIDRQITFFTKYGLWLDYFCAGGVIILIIVIIFVGIMEKKLKGKSK